MFHPATVRLIAQTIEHTQRLEIRYIGDVHEIRNVDGDTIKWLIGLNEYI